jgi:hypothetical protein
MTARAAIERRDRQRAIRAQNTAIGVRKVWVLPPDLVDRIVNYQAVMRLPSEVAAARELLAMALNEKGYAP